MQAKSAGTHQEQAASDEGKYPHDHNGGYACPKTGAVDALLRCDDIKVMHCMPEVQCGEQDSNPTYDV
jgi:hypothetical protein